MPRVGAGDVQRRALRSPLKGLQSLLEEGPTTVAADPWIAGAVGLSEPFTTLVVDGRCGVAAVRLAYSVRCPRPPPVHGDRRARGPPPREICEVFGAAGFAAYLVRPVRPARC